MIGRGDIQFLACFLGWNRCQISAWIDRSECFILLPGAATFPWNHQRHHQSLLCSACCVVMLWFLYAEVQRRRRQLLWSRTSRGPLESERTNAEGFDTLYCWQTVNVMWQSRDNCSSLVSLFSCQSLGVHLLGTYVLSFVLIPYASIIYVLEVKKEISGSIALYRSFEDQHDGAATSIELNIDVQWILLASHHQIPIPVARNGLHYRLSYI